MANKKSKISYISANITSVMSVTMVLVLLGLVGLLGLVARALTKYVEDSIGFEVVMTEDATDDDVARLNEYWKVQPYTQSVKFVSKEEALKVWEMDTGEDLMEVVGVNPLSAEFEVRIKPEYACADSLTMIEKQLKTINSIADMQMHKNVVEQINQNVHKYELVLLIIAVMLMIISFALINNTVRLTVYSRRFSIHTMQLVGATPGFIRRPFIVVNVLNGLLASVFAILILSGGLYYVYQLPQTNAVDLQEMVTTLSNSVSNGPSTIGVDWLQISYVFAGLTVVGMLICGFSAFLATNKYLNQSLDDLFTE